MRLQVLQKLLSLFCQKCGTPQIKMPVDPRSAESIKKLPFEKRVSFFWERLCDSHCSRCYNCNHVIDLVKPIARKDNLGVYLNCPKTNEPVTMESTLKFFESYDDSFYIDIGTTKEQFYESAKSTKYVWVPKPKEKKDE